MGLKARTPKSSTSRRPKAGATPVRTPARRVSSGKSRVARRRAGNDTVEAYIARLDAELRAVTERLRELVRESAPDATESIKWAQPVYEIEGPFAYLRASTGHVTLGFWRGAELADPRGLLEGEGERMMHLKLAAVDEIDADAVRGFVREAVSLNRQHGNPTIPRVARATPVRPTSAETDAGWTRPTTEEVSESHIESESSLAGGTPPGGTHVGTPPAGPDDDLDDGDDVSA
jgi:hypothetical protein